MCVLVGLWSAASSPLWWATWNTLDLCHRVIKVYVLDFLTVLPPRVDSLGLLSAGCCSTWCPPTETYAIPRCETVKCRNSRWSLSVSVAWMSAENIFVTTVSSVCTPSLPSDDVHSKSLAVPFTGFVPPAAALDRLVPLVPPTAARGSIRPQTGPLFAPPFLCLCASTPQRKVNTEKGTVREQVSLLVGWTAANGTTRWHKTGCIIARHL